MSLAGHLAKYVMQGVLARAPQLSFSCNMGCLHSSSCKRPKAMTLLMMLPLYNINAECASCALYMLDKTFDRPQTGHD